MSVKQILSMSRSNSLPGKSLSVLADLADLGTGCLLSLVKSPPILGVDITPLFLVLTAYSARGMPSAAGFAQSGRPPYIFS